ncbi:sensor histidine kinase [Cytobacillus gottheilii]|uniref:sensor histidine kinase n=1 Tax=Cytobacillus gottheilii TaxID=859144 RepID=UPI0009BBDC5D|nr:sensor histidine kinase [Cytobacillus gottheilii]
MKKTYLIWLAFHCIVWIFTFIDLYPFLNEWQIGSVSFFLLLVFILPLFKDREWLQTAIFCVQGVLSVFIFYPDGDGFPRYMLLIQILIMAEAVFYLSRLKSILIIAIISGGEYFTFLQTQLTAGSFAWYGLIYLLVICALLYYQTLHRKVSEVQERNDALQHEYRRMKRLLVTEEEQTRKDERMQIGHEIHDSVGHKLTALVMQFEVFRLSAEEKDKEKIAALKELAQQSLEETRRAVRSFKDREVGGLQGVIRLIRKLELESFMKINFIVKHGAFAAPLTGEQSFAIYRAVQEGLTNIMKHAHTKDAQVLFESPGGSIFRFEVSNATAEKVYFEEGYGLKAMRDRLEKVGGILEVVNNEREFMIRGVIRLTDRSGRND